VSRLLYVDAIAGVAGDMLLGALLDAGASLERVRAGLAGLGVAGLDLAVERTERHGIGAVRVRVVAPPEHAHRDWAAVRELVDRAALPPRAHARAHEAFRRLAEAEGAIHGVAPDEVRFHEVGAIDALADVCGVALALEDLGVDRVACSPLPAPRGFVRAAHGRLPLPAPATLELLRGAALEGVDLDVELVTPTGAALVAALAEGFGPLPALALEGVGYGAGARDLAERPNLVRVVLGRALGAATATHPVRLLEANLDDLQPELVPDAVEACFAAGALDVWLAPVHMKRGRPGVVVSALARPERERAVAEALVRSTTTLGVRVTAVERHELERETAHVAVDGHQVAVKVGRLAGEVVNLAPEHADIARLAARLGRPVRAVWATAFAVAQRELGDDAG
jgi:uncharacterized protein (TIGR00299 family) protein